MEGGHDFSEERQNKGRMKRMRRMRRMTSMIFVIFCLKMDHLQMEGGHDFSGETKDEEVEEDKDEEDHLSV